MAISHHQRECTKARRPAPSLRGIRSGEVHFRADLLQLGMCSEEEPSWWLKIIGHLLIFCDQSDLVQYIVKKYVHEVAQSGSSILST